MIKIMFDPGHGGSDPGATGNGLRESDVVLDIGLRARKYLLATYECEVRMTRTDDVFVSLAERVNMANRWGANVFVSLHVNGFHLASAWGYEDFRHISLSRNGATARIQTNIHSPSAKKWTDNSSPNRGMKQANFYVLRETAMPAVLVENGFITNRHDARLLKNPAFIQAIAEAHADGIADAMGLDKKQTSKPSPLPPSSDELPAVKRAITIKVNGEDTDLPGWFVDGETVAGVNRILENIKDGLAVDIEVVPGGDHINIVVPDPNVNDATSILRLIAGLK